MNILILALFCTHPLLTGVGYGMVIISGIVCIYYNIIITWTLYYLFKSFTMNLPWSTCDNEWNMDACMLSQRSNETMNGTDASNATWFANATAGSFGLNLTQENSTAVVTTVVTEVVKRKTPSEEFWE